MEQSRELSQLFDACTQGKVDIVNSLLDGGFDVSATDEDDTTALQIAAANGQEQVVRLLLVRGAAVDQSNVTGWTALLHAVRNGHTSVAALLIQNHASVDVRTCYGAGVACLAARSGNLATCRLLEAAGVSFAATSGDVGSGFEITPLVVASHRGHDSVVKQLLSSADVNCPVQPTGVTALMGAVVGGQVSTARLIVEHGQADIDAVDVNEKSALDYSIALNRHQVKEYLQTKTTRSQYPSLRQTSPSIIDAIKHGNIEQVRDILDNDVTQRDACMPQDGATPLMFAAMLGHFPIVQLLIQKGCNVNAQDTANGWTALMQAIFHGQKEVAVHLLQAGADVTASAKSGCNAFDMASIISGVDTELYQLIAARAMPIIVPQQIGIPTSSSSSLTDTVRQKSGIKAWWSRISNRFHNLKQPEDISSARYQLAEVAGDVTLKDMAMERSSPIDASLASNPLTAMIGAGNSLNATGQTLKTDHRTSLLDVSGIMTPGGAVASSTLKSPGIPPVFPLPLFHSDRTSKMPPASLRKPLTNQSHCHSLSTAVSPGGKLLQNKHLTLNLVNRIASPPLRVQFARRPAVKMPAQVDVSPSASCDAATLGGSGDGDAVALPRSKCTVLSSASGSTLTAGSTDYNAAKTSPSVELLRSNRNKLPNSIKPKPVGSDKQDRLFRCDNLHSLDVTNDATTPNLSSLGCDSGIGTGVVLSKTPVDRFISEHEQRSDLGVILQKLSLECYQPVFEEQEVDMEAFLTLSDRDLKELGIESSESRRQILVTISELNVNKQRVQRRDGEQQLYQNRHTCTAPPRSFSVSK